MPLMTFWRKSPQQGNPERKQASPVPPESEQLSKMLKDGATLYHQNRFNEAIAYFIKAQEEAIRIGDNQRLGTALGNLGTSYEKLKQYDKAKEAQEERLAVSRKTNDRHAEGIALGNLGVVYRQMGQFDKAIETQQQRLVIARELKDQRAEAIALGNIGVAYGIKGDHEQAIKYHNEQFQLAKDIGDSVGQMVALGNLTVDYEHTGRTVEAEDAIQRRLALKPSQGKATGAKPDDRGVNGRTSVQKRLELDKIVAALEAKLLAARKANDFQTEQETLGAIGVVWGVHGDYNKALGLHQRQLMLCKGKGMKTGECGALGNLGVDYEKLEMLDKAIEVQHERVTLATSIEDKQSLGMSYGHLGLLYCRKDMFEKSIEMHTKQLEVATSVQDKRGISAAHCNIGVIYDKMANYTSAIEQHEAALNLSREVKDQRGEAMCLGNLGIAYRHLGNHKKAVELQEQRYKIVKLHKDLRGQAVTMSNIALSCTALGDVKRARSLNEKSLKISRSIGDNAASQALAARLGLGPAPDAPHPPALDASSAHPTLPPPANRSVQYTAMEKTERPSQDATPANPHVTNLTIMENPLEAFASPPSFFSVVSTRAVAGRRPMPALQDDDTLDMDDVEMTLAEPNGEIEALTEAGDNFTIHI